MTFIPGNGELGIFYEDYPLKITGLNRIEASMMCESKIEQNSKNPRILQDRQFLGGTCRFTDEETYKTLQIKINRYKGIITSSR